MNRPPPPPPPPRPLQPQQQRPPPPPHEENEDWQLIDPQHQNQQDEDDDDEEINDVLNNNDDDEHIMLFENDMMENNNVHHDHPNQYQHQHQQQEGGEGNEMTKVAVISIQSVMIPGDTIKVLVSANMTQNDFANCISHATFTPPNIEHFVQHNNNTTNYYYWNNNNNESNWTHHNIAGLFRKSDGVFVPISLILQCPFDYEDDIFHLSRYPEPLVSSKSSSSSVEGNFLSSSSLSLLALWNRDNILDTRNVILVAIIAVGIGLLLFNLHTIIDFIENTFYWILNLPSQLLIRCIDNPLKDLYRNGPTIIGWEGSTLPKICTQITHMGDETFWSRNLKECENIYLNKEQAMLQIRKPIVYIILCVSLFYAIQSLIKTWSIRNQNRPSREMVEAYEIYRLIVRILQRGMMIPPPPPAPPMRHDHLQRRF